MKFYQVLPNDWTQITETEILFSKDHPHIACFEGQISELSIGLYNLTHFNWRLPTQIEQEYHPYSLEGQLLEYSNPTHFL
jgi:hypothetical protein